MFSQKVINNLSRSSWIRAMFEEGEKLRKIYGPEKVYDFSIGNPEVEPPVEVTDSLKRQVLNSAPGKHRYMSNAGHTDVREKVAAQIQKETGVDMPFANIVMTCGAAGGLNVVLKALLNPGEEVIVLAPYFAEYMFYIDNHGGKPVIVNTDFTTFQPSASALEAAITANTKAIILNTPNNPTGVIYNEETLTKLKTAIETKERELGTNIFIVSDEPYAKIVYDNAKVPPILKIFNNSIAVNSYSKSLALPGERIGYIAVNSKIDNVNQLLAALIFCNRTLGYVNAPSLIQKVVADAIDASVDMEFYKERRDLIYNHLIKCGFECIKPEGAFYLFVKSPIADDVEFCKTAQKYNLLVVPGQGFGCPGYFRLCYCVNINTIKNSLPAFEELAKEINIKPV